jgi:hypothetical protein
VYGRWAAINQVLRNTPLENGYGAGRIVSWLFSGEVFDAGRAPVISLLVLIGVVTTLRGWRTRAPERALVMIGFACLVLSFGRTTFGPLVDVIPGASDLFFRRFLMGAQLAGLLLAGSGLLTCAKATTSVVHTIAHRLYVTDRDRKLGRRILFCLAGLISALLAILVVSPIRQFDERNAAAVRSQHASEEVSDRQLAPLIDFISRHGGGRTYAGLPTNWGSTFTVGMVPVYKYLESADIDEVGYTLRTASLMTDPEYYFDEANSADYELFGVRYLLLPVGMSPPTPATPILRSGPYALWAIDSNGYFNVVETVGTLSENRADVATQSLRVLRSDLIVHHRDLSVDFSGSAGIVIAPQSQSGSSTQGTLGSVGSAQLDLADGVARATVHLTRRGVVVLSASFDPGWQVTVDGRDENTHMLAPAVIGVVVSPGTHRVVFTYRGFSHYGELIGIGSATLLALLILTWRRGPRGQPPGSNTS